MVNIMVDRIGKMISKLENDQPHRDHHHESEALAASIQGFHSLISTHLNDLALNPKLKSEIMSFPWIKRCFELLRVFHKGFAKLIVEIDYPVRKWEAYSGDEFLNYTLKLLELFNSISSSLSHLSQARLKLSHALSSVQTSPSSAISRLKAIEPSSFTKDSIKEGETGENRIENLGSETEKQSVVHQALMTMNPIGCWVCGIVISGLSGDTEAYIEMRKPTEKLGISSFNRLDSIVYQTICESEVLLKEVKEVNSAVDHLVSSMAIAKSISNVAAEDMRKSLEVLEKEMEGLRNEVDSMFSDILEERNKVLDCLRRQ